MLAVCKKEEIIADKDFANRNHDITVSRIKKVHEYNKDGTETIKREKEKINVTRKINETAKVLKRETAQEKLDKIKNALKGV